MITQLDQVTPTWLTTALSRAEVLPKGEVVTVDVNPERLDSDSMVLKIRVVYSSDAPSTAPQRLFLKVNRREKMLGIPGLGEKEVRFYQAVAQGHHLLPVVRCYDAIYSAEAGGYHLLLDDLSETHIAFPPSQLPPIQAHCEQIIDALADLHAYWWARPQLGDMAAFPTENRLVEDYRADAESYLSFADFLGDRLSPRYHAVYRCVLEQGVPLLIRRLASGKDLTLTFEDVHAGNFLYPREPAQDRLYIIDWEQWGINVAAHDLAYMMAMFWSPERRSRLEKLLLQRYHSRLIERGVQGYGWDDLLQDYRLAILRHLFTPVWQQQHGLPPDIWWNHLERIMAAYTDWNCDALFTIR